MCLPPFERERDFYISSTQSNRQSDLSDPVLVNHQCSESKLLVASTLTIREIRFAYLCTYPK